MSAASSLSQNPFEAAKAKLIERIAQLVVPKNPGAFWRPADFERLAEHMKEGVALFDDWMREMGAQVENNSPYNVDAGDFETPCSNGAADAIYAPERIAERMRDDREAA